MNNIDLHLSRVLPDRDIIETVHKMLGLDRGKIVLTVALEDIVKHKNFDIWIHKIPRKYGDFPLTLSIYPQTEECNKTELEFAEYFCEHNSLASTKLALECAIVPPGEHGYAEWLLVSGVNKNQIFTEDFCDYPEDEDGITLSIKK